MYDWDRIGESIAIIVSIAVAGGLIAHYAIDYLNKKEAERTVDKIDKGLERITSEDELTDYLIEIQEAIPNLRGNKPKQNYAEQLQQTIEGRLTTLPSDKPTESQKVVPIEEVYLKYGAQDK